MHFLSLSFEFGLLALSAAPFCASVRHIVQQTSSSWNATVSADAAIAMSEYPTKKTTPRRDISLIFCCGSKIANNRCLKKKKQGKGVDPIRTHCKDQDPNSHMICTVRLFNPFGGTQCFCQAGYFWNGEACAEPETVLVAVGGKRKQSVEVSNVDMVEMSLEPTSGKTLRQEIENTGQDKRESLIQKELEAAKAAGKGSLALMAQAMRTSLAPAINTLVSAGTLLGGFLVRAGMNMNNDKLEKLVQWLLGAFLLNHDDGPKAKCHTGKTPSGNPDYGKCFYDLSWLQEPQLPFTKTVLFSGGKPDENADSSIKNTLSKAFKAKFDITLATKIGSIRGLEALQVQKSVCYGNFLEKGGFCELELAPEENHPLVIKDVEVDINCEGACYASQQVTAMLSSNDDFKSGDIVYINKGSRGSYRGRELDGCVSMTTRSRITGYIHVQTGRVSNATDNIRWCVEAEDDGTNLACWAPMQLIPESGCKGKLARAYHWVANKLLAPEAASAETQNTTEWNRLPPQMHVRTIMYRKFDVVLKNVKIRAKLKVHRTRSLQQVVNEADMTKKKKKGLAGFLSKFYDKSTSFMKVLQHPREWALSDRELVAQYGLNTQPIKGPGGHVIGYKLESCENPVWDYDANKYMREYEKCYRIVLSDLQLLATDSDYVSIEETASYKTAPEGFRFVLLDMLGFYSKGLMSMLGYDNVGFVLASMTKLMRMMFVRDVATIKVGNAYCKDKWDEPFLKGNYTAADKSRARGVKCGYKSLNNPGNEQGSGIRSGFEFELVELYPVWNEEEQRNEIEIGLRGGYNLKFCRVIEEGKKVGNLICDFDPPVKHGTQSVEFNGLPDSARFRFEFTGEDQTTSHVVIASSETNSTTPSCTGRECDELRRKSTTDIPNAAKAAAKQMKNKAIVRILSKATGKYCHQRIQHRKSYLTCDHAVASQSNVVLEGNVDPFIPSLFWDYLFIMMISCFFAASTKSFWGIAFGALTGTTIVTIAVNLVFGAMVGYVANYELVQRQHLDGIMLRYLMKSALQETGQGILYSLESWLAFEFLRK